VGHYLDTLEHRKALQRALNAALGNQLQPQLEVDGVLGNQSAAAVRLWRQVNGKVITGADGKPVASVDNEMLRLLGLGQPLITEPGTLGNTIALPIINLVLNTALKGTGITMDFSKIAKAIAGGLSGAGIGGGAAAYTYLSLPPSAADVLPHWVPVAVPIVNMAIGFVVGFSVVYFAPANKPA
jgi:peptidoglycan hydrolase-like protein with peptidoglycan-binding domain